MRATAVHVRPGPLRGRLRLPGDRDIGHIALVLAALGRGDSLIRGLDAARHVAVIEGLRAMGVPVAVVDEGVRVKGVGLRGLRSPKGTLEAHTPLGVALWAALLSAQGFGTRVQGHGEAAQGSVHALVESLRARGAQVAGSQDDGAGLLPPVAVAPLLEHESLAEAELAIPGGDPCTKAAMLLSGLYVQGVTAVSEGMLSPDHMERALLSLGVPVQTMGPIVVLDLAQGEAAWDGFDWEVPADNGLFAWLSAAALGAEGSEVVFEAASLNPTRGGWLDALRHAGADVAVAARGESQGGEPWGVVRVRSSQLRSLQLGGELLFRALSELPALCALAPAATGRLQVRDVPPVEARRLRALSSLLRDLGIESTAYEDGIDLDPGRGESTAERVDCQDDPWLAACALAVALGGRRSVRLERAGGLFALYPSAQAALTSLGVALEVEESP